MKFSEFLALNEDGEGGGEGSIEVSSPVNTTANIEGYSLPIGMSLIKMPQIDKNSFGEFTSDLDLNGFSCTAGSMKCGDLTPSQNEFDPDKVKSIKSSIVDGTYNAEPILVSGDDYIVDGHHRWKAFDQNADIDVNKVDMKFEELFDFLDNKPYVIRRDIK